MLRPAVSPGRLLELCGDTKPRRMIVHDRTRLIGRLRTLLYVALQHKWESPFFDPLGAEQGSVQNGQSQYLRQNKRLWINLEQLSKVVRKSLTGLGIRRKNAC